MPGVIPRTLFVPNGYTCLLNLKRGMELARAVHTKVDGLTEMGYTKLCPPDTNTQIAFLRIFMENRVAVIYQVKWDEWRSEKPSRMFKIKANGYTVRRSTGWWNASLARQLNGLLSALQTYAPRFDVQKVPREDH